MCTDKAEPKKLSVWVKMINVSMEAWCVKRISALTSSIGKPIIMDEVTTKMCVSGVGRIGFAKANDGQKEFKDSQKVQEKGTTSKESNNGGGILGSNMFTLLDSLVNEEDLVPAIDKRKIADDFLHKKCGINNMEINDWSEEMKSHSDKQKEVKKLIQEEGLQLCAILETHVKFKNIKKICENVFEEWEYITNGEDNNKGCKIMIEELRKEVDMFPHDEKVKEKSCMILKEYQKAIQDEYSLLCQKAKVEWLKEEDRNTVYFYKTLKERVHRGRIMTIRNEEGVRYDNDEVPTQIVKHFKELLGKSSQVLNISCRNIIFRTKLSTEEALEMVRPISDPKIKNAMFEIEDSKALGPDGYTSRFYKTA
nr:hypothetical protein [Tanacetum cinerariifolium]